MPLSSSRRALAAAALAAASMAGLARAEPQVQSLTCSPGIVDARAQDVLVTCAMRVLDKDADLDFAYTRLVSPSGKFSLPLFFDGKKSIGLASFTGANLAAQVTIPRHAEPGYWQLDFGGENGLRVKNVKGGEVLLRTGEADALGLTQLVKVYSPGDETPPYIKDLACTTPVFQNNTRLEPLPMECRFTLVDTGAGVAMARVSFASPDGAAKLHLTADASKDLVEKKGNGEVVLQASVPGYPGMTPGRWNLLMEAPFAPFVQDKNLNGFSYTGADAASLWTRPFFEVFSTLDVTPPVVQKFGCSATQVVVPYAGADTYSCQLVVQDDLSGFAYGELAFENPDRNATAVLRFDANTRQVQFSRGGIFAPVLSFDPTAPGGMWTVSKQGLVLRDIAGNQISYNPKELNERQYPTFLLVSKADKPDEEVKSPAASPAQASYTLMLASLLALFVLRR